MSFHLFGYLFGYLFGVLRLCAVKFNFAGITNKLSNKQSNEKPSLSTYLLLESSVPLTEASRARNVLRLREHFPHSQSRGRFLVFHYFVADVEFADHGSDQEVRSRQQQRVVVVV
eukprot:c11121_g1_i3.p1 GENE.c11121_g1_i3~~c11121_g1_i3.p1  ORF type:complete len:115 (+),score=23.68 c11121_g1_i3:320-664(+)